MSRIGCTGARFLEGSRARTPSSTLPNIYLLPSGTLSLFLVQGPRVR